MCPIEVNMTYEPFSKEPEYIEANRAFMRNMRLTSCKRILDLACGVGTMIDLILEVHQEVEITGLDVDSNALLLAQKHFKEMGLLQSDEVPGTFKPLDKLPKLYFVHGTADNLQFNDESFNAVIMGNSIHLLPDEEKLIIEVYRVLQPGGFFAFNSTFYAGAMPQGTEQFHHEWVKQALYYIKSKDEELRRQGLAKIPRKRGTANRAFSKRWPSLDDWRQMLTRKGFEVKFVNERTVNMNKRCFETIGAYAGLASVLFSGYPVHLASEALQETVGQALSIVGMEVVPRCWLEIIATKSLYDEKSSR